MFYNTFSTCVSNQYVYNSRTVKKYMYISRGNIVISGPPTDPIVIDFQRALLYHDRNNSNLLSPNGFPTLACVRIRVSPVVCKK